MPTGQVSFGLFLGHFFSESSALPGHKPLHGVSAKEGRHPRHVHVTSVSIVCLLTPSTAPIFEVRLNQNFVENIPRKNTTITTFHAVSKEGTGLFTDFPNFCYRVLFALSLPSTQNRDLSANRDLSTPR